MPHTESEASGQDLPRPLWGGNSSSMNLLCREAGGLPGSSELLLKAQPGLPVSGRRVNLGLEHNFYFRSES